MIYALLFIALTATVWMAGDAIHAGWIRSTLSRERDHIAERRRHNEPFCLNPAGSPALLLIHGFADGPSVFSKMAPILAEAGFAVRAMRLSASGGIPPEEMAGICLDTWRKDIQTELHALQAAEPGRPIWLVGHSMGSTLAFDAGLRNNDAVAGLVLLAPLIEPSNERSPILTSRQWFTVLNRMLFFSSVVRSGLPKDVHDPHIRKAYSTDRYLHRDLYRALFESTDAIVGHAADWTGPLMVVLSPSDQVVDNEATTRFVFSASNAVPLRLSEQYSGGHVLPLDFGYEQLAGKIIRFIRDPQQLPVFPEEGPIPPT
ncbi:MAG: lysophospholipase [Verrucomicrobiota bacterium]|jgi:alpha-beta hydrolase superfamily lysophospholipase|nr:lysophospholipase [Verrucomicrobiota bacterium]